jgi:acid phosphatase type 7
VADSYTRADRPERTFGSARRLRLDSRPRTRAYLRFGLAGIPRPVRRAVLSVWAARAASAGFSVRATRSSWREPSLNYRRAPRAAGRIVKSGRVTRGWKSVDVTALVRRAGSSITFVLSTSSTEGLTLASREDRSRAPRLRVSGRPRVLPPAGSVVLAGAGDIADDDSDDSETAVLLDSIHPDIVFTLGDNAYDSGTAKEFNDWYDSTWGRHRARTRPAAGNHDYRTPGASGYFDYFGARAGDRTRGYYSYEAGAWHVVVLNTNGEGPCATILCNGGSAQERWLRADLAASNKPCTLAYWHHPRYSIGPQGTASGTQALWQALYADGVELALAGNDHNYQRWKPMNAAGAVDTARGIRSFVVGTGGGTADRLGSHPNVEAARTGTPGVLKLTLGPGTYRWEFVPIAGRTFRDSGTGSCH